LPKDQRQAAPVERVMMKRRRPAWVAVAGVIALACGCANATPRDRRADPVEPRPTASPVEDRAHGIDRELSETLQEDVDRVRENQSLPGVSAAVVIPDEGVWTGTSGIADARTKQPATPDTLFAIGSVTKPFVAALLVQLAQEGELDLDDRLSRWVPDFPNSDEITVRQLLGHTSGTANFTDDRGFVAAQQRRPGASWSPAETLSFARTPRAKPGAEWAYSNTNYILAGLVLERASNSTVGSQLHRRLLVGPEFSRMLLQPEQRPRGPVATGHEDLDGDSKPDRLATRGYVPTRAFASAAWTAGGMLATAGSLARAADGIFRGDLLPVAARREMTRFKPTGQTEFEYGLGLGRIWLGDQLVWWHNGDYPGFHADLAFIPERGVTVVALNNFQRNAPAQEALIDTMISDVSMHLADSP
jgi:D-alanyl-D-alanine carboxypeptidase